MSYRNSYVDGVPLVLSKKFYPIPKTRYKEIECHIPLDALQEGYEFNLERQVLVESENYEKEKEKRQERLARVQKQLEVKAQAEAEAAAEKAAALVREYEEELAKQQKYRGPSGVFSPEGSVTTTSETTDRSRISSPETVDTSPTDGGFSEGRSSGTELPPLPNYGEESPSGSGMLPKIGLHQQQSHTEHTPINSHDQQQQVMEFTRVTRPEVIGFTGCSSAPLPAVPIVSGSSLPADVSKASGKLNKFNLSDFESDTANPFDNVEMKSINDMAVLASVLQNNLTCASVPPNLPTNNALLGSTTVTTGVTNPLPGMSSISNGGATVNASTVLTNVNGITNAPAASFYGSYRSQNLNQPGITSSASFGSWNSVPSPYFNNQSFRPVETMCTSSMSSQQIPSSNSTACNASLPVSIPISSSHSHLDPVGSTVTASQVVNPNVENFANYYFPFTSSHVQSRLQTKDREFI